MRSSAPKLLRRAAGKDALEPSAPAARPAEPAPRPNDLGLFPKEPPELIAARAQETGPQFVYDYLLRGGDLEQLITDHKKRFPLHIPHWDPASPRHIPSEADDEAMTANVGDHNRIMEEFRRDLLLQGHMTELWEGELARAPRGVPGVNRNVYAAVADYDPKTGYEQPSPAELENRLLEHLTNEKMINRSLFIPKMPELSHLQDWRRDLEARPVTAHFHAGKGSKFDVETPEGEKFPHVADRLGHPELFPRPADSLLRLENVNCHPGFLDFPFAQTPPTEPDPALDLAPGEVLFYKPNNLEWGRFWAFNYAAVLAFAGAVHPYLALVQSSVPFPFIAEETPVPLFYQSINNIDYWQMLPPFALAGLACAAVVGARLINAITRCYPAKLQLNQARDLVFVTSHDALGRRTERAYELEHLEILPPSTKTATQFIDGGAQGLTTVKCLNSGELFVLHNDPRYWNAGVRGEFLSRVRRLWDKSYYERSPY